MQYSYYKNNLCGVEDKYGDLFHLYEEVTVNGREGQIIEKDGQVYIHFYGDRDNYIRPEELEIEQFEGEIEHEEVIVYKGLPENFNLTNKRKIKCTHCDTYVGYLDYETKYNGISFSLSDMKLFNGLKPKTLKDVQCECSKIIRKFKVY